MDMVDVPAYAIAPEDMLPAIAQGTIGIERRADDMRAKDLLAPLHDAETGHRLAGERALLAALDGSCETPIGGLAMIEGDQIWLRGEILSPDGSLAYTGERRGGFAQGATLGRELAAELLEQAGPNFLIGKT